MGILHKRGARWLPGKVTWLTGRSDVIIQHVRALRGHIFRNTLKLIRFCFLFTNVFCLFCVQKSSIFANKSAVFCVFLFSWGKNSHRCDTAASVDINEALELTCLSTWLMPVSWLPTTQLWSTDALKSRWPCLTVLYSKRMRERAGARAQLGYRVEIKEGLFCWVQGCTEVIIFFTQKWNHLCEKLHITERVQDKSL